MYQQTKMNVPPLGRKELPRPQIVSQRLNLLPDGSPDPEWFNDCGEACVASVLLTLRGFMIPPGCLRAAEEGLKGPGLTNGPQLAHIATSIGLSAVYAAGSASAAWTICHHLRRVGRYAVILGEWLSPGALHWLLAYEGDRELVWCMDPWNSEWLGVDNRRFMRDFAGQLVMLWP